jgi:S1-C subfamily serine protease
MRAVEWDAERGWHGDVIVAIDGKPTETPADVYKALDGRKVGDQVAVKVDRNGQEADLTVTLKPLR